MSKGKTFGMGGTTFYGKSPLYQKQVKLNADERAKGVMRTGGSNSEVINDAEDRIEYITSDAKEKTKNNTVRIGPTKDNLQIQKLQNSIKIARSDIKRNNNNTTRILGPKKRR